MPKNTGNNSGGKRPPNASGLGKKPRPSKTDGVKKPINYVKDDTPRMDRPRKVASTMPQTNKRLGEFVVDRFGHDGRGVASLEGKTLFIDGALAGETVTARLVEEHPRYIEARVDQVLVAAPRRVTPPCAHFAECGGCQLQYMALEQQLEVKQEALLEQLLRWGGVSPQQLLPPITSAGQGYRHRARLGVWYEADGSVTLGFRQKQSKNLVHIEQCWVLAPVLNQLLAPLHLWLTELRAQKPVTHMELIAAADGAVVIVRHTKNLAAADLSSLQQLATTQGCQIWLEPNGDLGLTDLQGESCDPRVTYITADSAQSLAFHPQDFTQVNPQVNQAMVQQAVNLLELKPGQRLLDLFCGIGNFTLPLAQHCAEVIGIEAVPAMVERGRENAERLGISNAKFIAGNLADMTHTQLQRLCGKVDAILLDPPRDGAKDIIANIQQLVARKQLLVPRIVYVSCNPATLARDAKLLADAGYILAAAGVLDMFPHTSHVESMALFLLE